MKVVRREHAAGVSLVEVVLAVGVLAVVLPLGLAALARAGETGRASGAETRAPAIAGRCRIELERAFQGASPFLPELTAGQAFPEEREVIALAFRADGRLLGKADAEGYRAGLPRLGGEEVAYLASLSGGAAETGVRTVTVRVEYPAVKPAAKRDGVSFHTKRP